MSTNSLSPAIDAGQLRDLVHRLLEAVKEPGAERRVQRREPFFHPVLLTCDRDKSRQYSCFARDISPAGMGLLHSMPVEPGDVLLTIPLDGRAAVQIRSRIVWCRPCGEGWYLSGAALLGVVANDQRA